jgi:hypothetical protein
MFLRLRRYVAVTFAALSVAVVGAPIASAQPVDQDGLVNVNIGDITLTDTVDAAVLIAANVCPNVNVGAVAILADRVDAGNVRQVTLCRTDDGRVTITNN